jgi:hypothetical protein
MNAIAHCAGALYAPDANPIASLVAEEGNPGGRLQSARRARPGNVEGRPPTGAPLAEMQ